MSDDRYIVWGVSLATEHNKKTPTDQPSADGCSFAGVPLPDQISFAIVELEFVILGIRIGDDNAQDDG